MTEFSPLGRDEYLCGWTGATMNQTPATTLDPQISVIARAVRPAAIQTDWDDALPFQKTRPPHGLPRRAAQARRRSQTIVIRQKMIEILARQTWISTDC
jgi:hypothetical protein